MHENCNGLHSIYRYRRDCYCSRFLLCAPSCYTVSYCQIKCVLLCLYHGSVVALFLLFFLVLFALKFMRANESQHLISMRFVAIANGIVDVMCICFSCLSLKFSFTCASDLTKWVKEPHNTIHLFVGRSEKLYSIHNFKDIIGILLVSYKKRTLNAASTRIYVH